MSQTQSPSRKRPYRLQRVCRVWQFPRSTVHEHRRRAALRPEERLERKKRGPQGPCTDDELAEKIRELLKASPFHGEGYRKMWAQLRAQDIRTSKERVRRVMREHGLQVPQRAGQPRGPQAHDGTITTERPDQMWGTDLTTTVTTGEGTATVFVAVDHCSSECIGIHAAATGDRFEALEPIHQGVREHFGGVDKGIAGAAAAPRSWLCVHVRPLPETDRLPGHRVVAQLRACPGGQWLLRAIHPHPQGESPVGPILCHGRRAPSCPARIQESLQREVAPRATQLSDAKPGAPELPAGVVQGGLTIRQISVQKPRALQLIPIAAEFAPSFREVEESVRVA